MTLREFLSNINDIVKEYPAALDLTVVYGSDEEGNQFQKVELNPSLAVAQGLDERYLEIEVIDDLGAQPDTEYNCLIIN